MTRKEALRWWGKAALIGATGAAVVIALDSTLGRIPELNGRPLVRAAGRTLAGAALAYGAHRAKLPEAVVLGAVAGPALVTVLDLATSAVSLRRLDPPAARDAGSLGSPWAPRMLP